VFHVKQATERAAEAAHAPESVPRLPLPPLPTLGAEVETKLAVFQDLLLRWNTRINLIADREATAEAVRTRHIADSLQLLSLIPAGDEALADLGSGGGFPGLVLAIAITRPVHLVESDRRKAAFLTEAAARLGLSHVRVHAARIEAVSLPPIAVVTARALAPVADLLPQIARLLTPGGCAILPKGRTAEAELTAALPDWTLQVERFASRTDPHATIFRLSDIRRAGPDT
jgi:16S rRNA (guanine527-N7)-methyltransferase